jgi:hypothetical protein
VTCACVDFNERVFVQLTALDLICAFLGGLMTVTCNKFVVYSCQKCMLVYSALHYYLI